MLAPHRITTAQVLVTLEDSENRRRYLNTRRTLGTLLELGVVPIVNENDTVATDEIRYGDNDRLAAQVASMAGADVLLLLSDVDGLYTANPRVDPTALRLDVVAALTPEIEAMAGGAGSALSTGRHEDQADRRAHRDARRLRHGDQRGRGRAAGAGAGAGRTLHLVRAGRRPARGAQALDLGDEAARPGDGRRRGASRRSDAASRCCRPASRRSTATSAAATRSRSPGRTGRWSPRRWRATMPARRG